MNQMKFAAMAIALGISGLANVAEAASYKFFSGNSYSGAYDGAGTIYAAVVGEPVTCPTGSPGCSGTDQTGNPLAFADFTTSTTGTGLYVREDLAPRYGGLGVDGDGDDQIDGSNVLTLTFPETITITGVATLFVSGHRPFGGGFGSSTPTETQLANRGIRINGTYYSFNDVNNGNISVAGSVFNFATSANPNDVNGVAVDYYVSGLTTVPIPAAAWLFGSALLSLIVLRKRSAD